MGRPKRNKPYDPSKITHNRQATDLLRNAQVVPIDVDDPMGLEPGDKIRVLRSTRDDPLADHHARHHIDEAQYEGGRAFQRDFETAERGPRAIDPSKEAVDGGLPPEPLTDAQTRAMAGLRRAYRELGMDGTALVHDVLVHGRTMAQVAASRGLSGRRWDEYFGMRFRECLDSLATVYGFAMERRG